MREKKITPYIHVLMNHVPSFIDYFGGLKAFEMDGVEQLNHVHRKVFFRCTNHKKKEKRTISDQISLLLPHPKVEGRYCVQFVSQFTH